MTYLLHVMFHAEIYIVLYAQENRRKCHQYHVSKIQDFAMHPPPPGSDNVESSLKIYNFLRSKNNSVYCSTSYMNSEGTMGNIVYGLWGPDAAASYLASNVAQQGTSHEIPVM